MEGIIKELGLKIDAMKNETVSKTELIEAMSKVSELETKGNEVISLREYTSCYLEKDQLSFPFTLM